MGRGQKRGKRDLGFCPRSVPQSTAKGILSFTSENFAKAILRELGEEKSSDEVAQYIEDVSDTSAIPGYVMPEFQKRWQESLKTTSKDGEVTRYQLVELNLERLEDRSLEGYGWVNLEKVKEYVRIPNPPAVVFREDNGQVEIFDGTHRLKAALTRGDATICAWVPRTVCS